jgi:transposase
MKYYTSTTQFNCGIDLHARQMYVCLMDRDGKKLVHTNIKNNDFAYFLKLIEPYKHDLTICCECMFGWYWLADACQAAGLHFVLAHALYLKANTVVAIKLARAVYFMLKSKTVFDPDRLVAALSRN